MFLTCPYIDQAFTSTTLLRLARNVTHRSISEIGMFRQQPAQSISQLLFLALTCRAPKSKISAQ
jgi:hypothetical protein